MKRKTSGSLPVLAACLLMFVAALVHCGYGQSDVMDKSGLQIKRTVLMSKLNNPWDMAFTGDGAMLFTEKCRGLSVRRSDGTVRLLFGVAGAALEANDFFCQGQSGMLGVAIDPEFSENRYVYVYMASNRGKAKTNRVVRLTVDETYTGVADRKDIVSDIPFKNTFNRWGGAGAHSGGRIRFSPFDGYLYVTTGDNHNGPLPQDLSRLGGKVLRIDRSGKPAAGNETPSRGDPRIFYLRTSQCAGDCFSSRHGPAFCL